MNFLAHFHLAWPEEGLLAGALEGDYYKGPIGTDLSPEMQAGVRLHRAIDGFTDAHPRLLALRRQLPTELRRYAGILCDLSFDHFLCQHWARFSDTEAEDFNAAVYATLQSRRLELSAGAQNMLARLVDHDILRLYQDWDTVAASAERIGQRFRRGNPFIGIERQLTPARSQLESAFLDFYPELAAFSRQQRAVL